MGWNDARARLLAPGWTMVSEESQAKALTLDGTPVRILRVERIEGSKSTNLCPENVRAWLEERGFVLTLSSPHGDEFQWEDIEASLCVQERELAEITLTFRLTRNSPCRWEIWKFIVEQLCETWDLGLYKPDVGFTIEPSEILRVLGDTQAWQEFEANFKWPSITSL